MSDLIRRAQQAQRVLGDLSLPKWRRVVQALDAFSGLELTGLDESTKQPLLADFAAVSQLFTGYTLKSDEDYLQIRDADLNRMLEILEARSTSAIAAELDRLVDALDAGRANLPQEALREAQQHRDLMTPRLIEILWDAATQARAGDTPQGNAHFFALFLLTQFRAQEALPAILNAITLPGELPFDLFGDAITSVLSRILARLVNEPETLDGLIGNPQHNRYVRWAAAQTFLLLVRDARLSRAEAVERLGRHLRQAIQNADAAIAGPLVAQLTRYSPGEVQAEIDEAFRRDLVEPMLISPEHVARAIGWGEAYLRKALERCEPSGIEDTIAELEKWSVFRGEYRRPPSTAPGKPIVSEGFVLRPSPPPDVESSRPSSPRAAVGRNDPCPCGSGKKFKRCCGAR